MNIKRKSSAQGTGFKNRVPIWQYLLLVLVLTTLSINALPNLFTDETTLTIPLSENSFQEVKVDSHKLSEKSGQEFLVGTDVLSAQHLESWLSSQEMDFEQIKVTSEKISISSSNVDDLNRVAERFKSILGKDYQFDIVTSSNRPTWLSQVGSEPLKLGLDLSGGVLFVLDVDLELALNKRLELIRSSILSTLIERKERPTKVKLLSGELSKPVVVVQSSDNKVNQFLVDRLAQDYPNLTAKYEQNGWVTFYYHEQGLRTFNNEIMEQSITTLRSRIEQLGITEAATQRQGNHRIRVELPGIKDPEQARKIIGATATLEFYQVQQRGNKRIKLQSGEHVSVNSIPIFTGESIRNARAGFDEMGVPLVNLALDKAGGERMLKYSSKNIGQQMLTVLTEYVTDGNGVKKVNAKVISNATILAQLGSRFSITNLESRHQAQELALLLRAGSLNAPIEIVKEQTIGATLGKDNIKNGFLALVLGVSITLFFMLAWYRKLGIIANVALLFNLTCLIGLMSLLPGVVLTLPGIAGLVLTVGMAVDTNVIIFERIKEERARGLSLVNAIEQGYKNATASIMDANLTTLITAMVLYSIGYGAIKGFAVTLGLGIVTSMFTGIFFSGVLTKTLYLTSELKKEPSRKPKPARINANLKELNHE